ncbi:hypothetical protein GCM10020331_080540 [Ectobacillus funiculus]
MIMTNTRIQQLQESWEMDSRWKGITRPYTAEDVIRLRGSIDIEHTLARRGAEKALEGPSYRGLHQCTWRINWKPGDAASKGWFESYLLERLAGGGRCQSCRPHVPRSKLVSGKQRASCCKTH